MTEYEWLNAFGDNLKVLLWEANMTQRELADAADLSESVISDYINKRKMPGVRAILNIAYALPAHVSELIDFGEGIV